MKYGLAFFSVLAMALAPSAAAGDAALYQNGPVQLDSGLISGAASQLSGDISVFKGIPYAQPPVGELRWKPPVSAKSWKGVRPAISFGAAARQMPMPIGGGIAEDVWQDEDCLYLNVWTPAETKDENLPVMVWIHGGGFAIGSNSMSSYNMAKLAQKGVVAVSINYRLNFFGQFAHPWLTAESEHGASGNYSLMDQIQALKWVQNNIAQFGGNPGNVTVFGESAGSRSTTLLVASPLAKGLFHKGICQSGAVRDVSMPRAEREKTCMKVADALGAKSLKQLRAMPWEAFAKTGRFNSNPIVDGWVIPEDPAVLYRTGRIHKVPLIIGINADEAMGFMLRSKIDSMERYSAYVKGAYGDDAPKILDLYADIAKKNVKDAVNHINTDSTMLLPALHQARDLERAGIPSYFYFFNKIPPTTMGKLAKAHHGAEIPYVMGDPASRWEHPEKADHDLSDAMMTYWTRFAATGDPNVEGLSRWPVYNSKVDAYLELGEDIKAGTHLRKDRISFWENRTKTRKGEKR